MLAVMLLGVATLEAHRANAHNGETSRPNAPLLQRLRPIRYSSAKRRRLTRARNPMPMMPLELVKTKAKTIQQSFLRTRFQVSPEAS